ncbi:MAG: EAL domain-containing protein [Desulfobulbus sp.]|nr:EAL domain-containing protein [Desulfobulbus sp.]
MNRPLSPAAEANRYRTCLQVVIASLPQGIGIFDENLQLREWNQGFGDLLHLSPENLSVGAHFTDLLRLAAGNGRLGCGRAENPEIPVQHLTDQARQFQPQWFTYVHPDGRSQHIQCEPLSVDGAAAGLIVRAAIDPHHHDECAERDHLALQGFMRTPDGLILTDDAYCIRQANPAACQITGHELPDLIGQSIFGLFSPQQPKIADDVRERLDQFGSWSGEAEILHKTGATIPVNIRLAWLDDPQANTSANHIWILTDITELRHQTEARLRHAAQHDALTDLPNRQALLLHLDQWLSNACRQQGSMAVMFIDLDRFKIINETLGHPVGDEVLRAVARSLSAVVRETDYVARLGGDEFAIVLRAIAMSADAAIVASKIIAALSQPIEIGEHRLHTSPSIGISIFPDDGGDSDALLRHADIAMYHAKATGRNSFQFFSTEMNRATSERLDIESKLRHAIDRGELLLHFQPQFAAGGDEPTGVEALLRWLHPSDGMIGPDRFIPIAEETGIINVIGEWVLRRACHQMADWIATGLPPLRMAVNVSARQLRRRDFSETVASALAESGLPAERLELEITESAVMDNPHHASITLQRLRRMGVTLAIDDFGTGYSSLAYLKRFPINRLKIDRSFVTDIEHDLNDRAIALGTIALAHSLGLKVIAEGVETSEQHDLLCGNDCDEVQGYLFSKPLDSAAAFAFLHARCPAR